MKIPENLIGRKVIYNGWNKQLSGIIINSTTTYLKQGVFYLVELKNYKTEWLHITDLIVIDKKF